jgi:hypothetical protein
MKHMERASLLSTEFVWDSTGANPVTASPRPSGVFFGDLKHIMAGKDDGLRP